MGETMDKVIIVFGSISDKETFNSISASLEDAGVPHEVKVCSAHRTPDELKKILGQKHSCVIAGAGLAAHLPGVIASKTVKLTIGAPVDNNYSGLDALLSIHQMPPGIPVLGLGITKDYSHLGKVFRQYSGVSIISDKDDTCKAAVNKARDQLARFKIKPKTLSPGKAPVKKDIVLNFTKLDSFRKRDFDNLVINIPCKKPNKPVDSLKVLRLSKDGFFVGLNRGDNAALAAVQAMGIKGKSYDSQMKKYRKEMGKKVMADDASLRKKDVKRAKKKRPVPKTVPRTGKRTGRR